MNKDRWVNGKIEARIQSFFLVGLMAALLGLVGSLIGGSQVAISLIVGLLMLYWLSPKMSPSFLLKLKSGRPLSVDEAPQLFEILRALSRRAELTRLPALFYLPTDAILAFTVGPRDNAAIALSQGLLRQLSRQELNAVLAHEISHIQHNDIRIMTFVGMAGQITRFLSVFGQFILLISLPMLFVGQMAINWPAIWLMIFSPTLSSLIRLALSRTREYNADLGAAKLTGNPEALASALAKIEKIQKRMIARTSWPMMPQMPQASWLRTHPPTKKRIQRLLALRAHGQQNRYRSSHAVADALVI